MRLTELVVVRHGETVWNAEGRVQGHQDSPLTEVGMQQARALADRLEKTYFAALYCSDLGRARTTADCIAERTGLPVVTDSRLRERNLGVFEGLTLDEIIEKYPQDYVRVKGGDPDYLVPGGESIQQTYDRSTACFADIARAHAGHRVVVVTHGGVLDDLLRFTLEIPLNHVRKFRLFNAGVNTFYAHDDTWTLGTWGDISHLNAPTTLDYWH